MTQNSLRNPYLSWEVDKSINYTTNWVITHNFKTDKRLLKTSVTPTMASQPGGRASLQGSTPQVLTGHGEEEEVQVLGCF